MNEITRSTEVELRTEKLNHNPSVLSENNNDYNTLKREKINISEEQTLPIIDQLLNEANYSSSQIKVIVFACLVMFVDGLHMSLLPSLFIPTKLYFQTTDMQLSIISSFLFLGVGLGSIFTSLGAKLYTRRFMIITCLITIYLMTLLLIITTNVFLFILFRFIIGFGIGIIVPIMMNIMCEYLPLHYRSFILISVNIFYNIAVVFLNSNMLIFMPNLEVEKLGMIYFIASLPLLVISILFFIHLKESPRALLIDKKETSAIILLEEIMNRSLTENEKDTLRSEAVTLVDNGIEGNFAGLFSKEYLAITSILLVLWSVCSFIIFGGTFTLSMLLTKVMNESNYETIKSQIYIYIISAPGCLIGAALTEVRCLGRKSTTLIGFILITLINIIGIIDKANISTYFGLLGICIGISFNAIGCYSCEVYHTKIRDVALGFLYSTMRLAGFLSQFIAMLLMLINPMSLFYVTVGLGILCSYLTYSLPYDTYGRPLDFTEKTT